ALEQPFDLFGGLVALRLLDEIPGVADELLERFEPQQDGRLEDVLVARLLGGAGGGREGQQPGQRQAEQTELSHRTSFSKGRPGVSADGSPASAARYRIGPNRGNTELVGGLRRKRPLRSACCGTDW